MNTEVSPEHLDRRNRTQRLYHHLLNLGLWVEPIFTKEEEGGMEYLLVSVSPLHQGQDQG